MAFSSPGWGSLLGNPYFPALPLLTEGKEKQDAEPDRSVCPRVSARPPRWRSTLLWSALPNQQGMKAAASRASVVFAATRVRREDNATAPPRSPARLPAWPRQTAGATAFQLSYPSFQTAVCSPVKIITPQLPFPNRMGGNGSTHSRKTITPRTKHHSWRGTGVHLNHPPASPGSPTKKGFHCFPSIQAPLGALPAQNPFPCPLITVC